MDHRRQLRLDACLALEAAGTVIFLDTPRLKCVWRVLKRRVSLPQPDPTRLTEGCPERLTGEFPHYVWSYPGTRRPAVLQKLAQIENKRVVHLRDDRAVAQFLEMVAAEYSGNSN